MFDLPSLRRQYGSVFVTNLDNGDIIPWKQLNVGEFLEYSILIENGVYAKATLEDEIFKKCVLDEYVVDSLPALKAGTVSTVVQDILSNSGPGNISELNSTLNVFRSVASQALHQTAAFICQAFPAYKLEDVYGMDYGDFMLRLAQSESKLLQLGVLQEPINFHDPSEVETESQAVEEKPSAMDLYQQYLDQQETKLPQSNVSSPAAQNQTVITTSDTRSLEAEMSGHEKEDITTQRSEMIEDGTEIYKDYLDQLSSGGKLKIKTPEERLAAARERAKVNEEAFIKAEKQRKESEKSLEHKYAEIFKKAAVKKK